MGMRSEMGNGKWEMGDLTPCSRFCKMGDLTLITGAGHRAVAFGLTDDFRLDAAAR